MHFTKMHGIGNDYVYVDAEREEIRDPERIAIAVSDRHFGIGSDGLILIRRSETADFEMVMYNADGSRGKMCGNGIRCVGKYVYDHGLTDKTNLTVETLAGIRTLSLSPGEDGKIREVRVDMGKPDLLPEEIPVRAGLLSGHDGGPIVSCPLTVEGREYRITCVSMGNPHCVIFLEEPVAGLALPVIGPYFEHHPLFPERVNTEFVNVSGTGDLVMRVWERGSGETLACGTGACACAVAAILNGKSGSSVTVHLLGGDLAIEWEGGDSPVYMTGPAEEVFEGEIDV